MSDGLVAQYGIRRESSAPCRPMFGFWQPLLTRWSRDREASAPATRPLPREPVTGAAQGDPRRALTLAAWIATTLLSSPNSSGRTSWRSASTSTGLEVVSVRRTRLAFKRRVSREPSWPTTSRRMSVRTSSERGSRTSTAFSSTTSSRRRLTTRCSCLAVIADSPFDARVHVRDHVRDVPDGSTTCAEYFARIEGRFDTAAEAVAFARRSVSVSYILRRGCDGDRRIARSDRA